MQLTESIANPEGQRYLELAESPASPIAPLACSLSTDDQRDRLEQWKTVLAQAELRTSAPDGLALRFLLDLDLALQLTRLIHAELVCCSFFAFQLAMDSRVMTLTVTAPGHGTDIVEQMFGQS